MVTSAVAIIAGIAIISGLVLAFPVFAWFMDRRERRTRPPG